MNLLHFGSLLLFLFPGQRTSIAGNVPAGDQIRGIGVGDLVKLSWLGNGNSVGIPSDFAFWKVGIENPDRGYSNHSVEAADLYG